MTTIPFEDEPLWAVSSFKRAIAWHKGVLQRPKVTKRSSRSIGDTSEPFEPVEETFAEVRSL